MIRHGSNTTLPMGDSKGEKKPKSLGAVHHPKHDRAPLGMATPEQLVRNPRFFLAVACFWPLAVLALFACSAPGNQGAAPSSSLLPDAKTIVVSPRAALEAGEQGLHMTKFEMRKILDRVDVMGYGPTHPRVAFVVVARTREALVRSVKSVFDTTDANRIFVVCAVLDDGSGEDPELVRELEGVEKNSE